MRNVVVLGSTGSIGTQAETVMKRAPDDFKVVGLAADGNRLDALIRQATELKPKAIAIFKEEKAELIKGKIPTGISILRGMNGILELCNYKGADTVLNAMVGMVGLRPTLETLSSGKRLLLANKESLVAGGKLVMRLVGSGNGAVMLPVDSEHSALAMCLRGNEANEVEKVTIYASGGPFFGKKREDLIEIGPEDALKHPNWAMGKVITIQSATLANKAREVIEAMWMYQLLLEQVTVLVERSSTFHASVRYRDGSEILEAAYPTMEIPIQYALYYPRRMENQAKRATLAARIVMFQEADRTTFKSLRLGEEAAQMGGTMATVFNAADEVAVQLFLDKKIGFLDIGDLTEEVMKRHENQYLGTLETVLRYDSWAREEVLKIVDERKAKTNEQRQN